MEECLCVFLTASQCMDEISSDFRAVEHSPHLGVLCRDDTNHQSYTKVTVTSHRIIQPRSACVHSTFTPVGGELLPDVTENK